MTKFLIALLLVSALSLSSHGQSAFAPFSRDYYHLIERYEIRKGSLSSTLHTGFKPFRRDHIAGYLSEIDEDSSRFSGADVFNLEYLRKDNWEFAANVAPKSIKKFLGGLYVTPADFFHYRDSVFDFHLNPVLYFHGGIENGESDRRFRNTRGLEIRGSIDRKIGFYTYLSTTDLVFPTWVRSYTQANGAVPGEGFWKRYGENGYSFFSATGYVTFQATDHVGFQLGHDRNFVGEGYRSMILSDFSNPYFFVKINTKIWKLNLTNLWGQMNADINYDRGFPTDGRYPQKWFSHHRLSANLGKKINVGIFESVMANSFDLNYLNPLIFYRWVEHQLGTPDKVMLGTDVKWNLVKGMQIYGQFALDEFVFNEFFGVTGKNSSRNKHGVQLGYKYVDVLGIPNMDLQLEYTQARPFTFQEKFDYQSFTNYRTPLTHPLGANFREAVGIIRYQPIPRLNLQALVFYQHYGKDPDEEANFGGDILKNRTSTSLGLFGNVIGQGVTHNVAMGTLQATYMVRHNLFFDLGFTQRNLNKEGTDTREQNQYLQGALRLNISRYDYHY